MKAKNIIYWITTVLIAAAFVMGGVVDLGRGKQVADGLNHLGYPLYLAAILGVWKILGAVAIVVPRFPLLKEWAYAGIFFDLTGASASHAFSGDGPRFIATPLVMLLLLVASWALRPASRRLCSEQIATPAREPQPTPMAEVKG